MRIHGTGWNDANGEHALVVRPGRRVAGRPSVRDDPPAGDEARRPAAITRRGRDPRVEAYTRPVPPVVGRRFSAIG